MTSYYVVTLSEDGGKTNTVLCKRATLTAVLARLKSGKEWELEEGEDWVYSSTYECGAIYSYDLIRVVHVDEVFL